LSIIESELGYQKYASKHYESIYTKWFQGFFLVKRFGIDKRRGHTSDLIRSNQLSREEALKIVGKPALSDMDITKLSEYVLKKFRKDQSWLNDLWNMEIKSYRDFDNNKQLIEKLKYFYNVLRKFKLVSV
jgi:hypothetical protein